MSIFLYLCNQVKINLSSVKKYSICTVLLLTCFFSGFSQHNEEKPTEKEVRKFVNTWNITENPGIVRPTIPDTIALNFQNTSTDHVYSIANAYCSNLGSPLEPKIYFDRTKKSDFLFMKPYSSYYKSVSDYTFYNTKSPFSNITYYRAGPSFGREERFNALFTVNVNSRFNIGFLADYIYGRGIYRNQSTNHIMGGLFGSYTGKRYEAHGIASLTNFQNFENGGIVNDLYITDPQQMRDNATMFKPQDIPVNLPPRTTSVLKNRLFYYNHKYHLGFEKTIRGEEDTITTTVFVPVTTFTHTVQYETNAKGYSSKNRITTDFYQNNFFNDSITQDTARFSSFKNTFTISLNEEFNRFAHFGLTAFASLDVQKFRYLKDTVLHNTNRSKTTIGGVLSKHLGERFKYDVSGEVCVLGDYLGEFKILGNVSNLFLVWGDSVRLSAQGFVENKKPDFFVEFYESNHFKWENHFKNEFKTHVSGRLAIPRLRFEFSAGVENLTNYIYFNNEGLPAQNAIDDVQVLALQLKQNFKVGSFHLDNQFVYQATSDKYVLPLSSFSMYSNLYFLQKWFKVLTVQLGVDAHYHTAYYAPFYMPATGQFLVQNEPLPLNEKRIKVGNYPVFNIYGNFHLKRARFFLLYYHANHNITEPNYFSMPHYPINPSMLKIGLSWNFYD